jgi:glutathione S-transferase
MADHDFVPPLNIWESGHILKYLAEKYDNFIPKEPRERVECFNWLFWLQASAPYIGGGLGHFYKYAPVRIEYAIDRYTMETKRLLDLLDKVYPLLSPDGRRSITGRRTSYLLKATGFLRLRRVGAPLDAAHPCTALASTSF